MVADLGHNLGKPVIEQLAGLRLALGLLDRQLTACLIGDQVDDLIRARLGNDARGTQGITGVDSVGFGCDPTDVTFIQKLDQFCSDAAVGPDK